MGLSVLDIIKEIHEEKKAKKVSPNFATRIEVKERISKKMNEELQGLMGDGTLKMGETLNDYYFELTKEE